MKWYQSDGDRLIEVQDVESACETFFTNIKILINNAKRTNQALKEENEKLKDEHYKDKELEEKNLQVMEAKKDLMRGFPISPEEAAKIEKWKREHEASVHGLFSLEDRLTKKGAIGGSYYYKFLPTSIGTSGSIVCSLCGESFEFQELG